MNKLILTDVDDVLLSWIGGFHQFMHDGEHFQIDHYDPEHYHLGKRYGIKESEAMKKVAEYNHSGYLAKLPPISDAAEYVAKLAEEGWRFIAITSIGDHPDVVRYRNENLLNVFGDIFDEIHCIPIGTSKADMLSRWKDSGLPWIEDHFVNAVDGLKAGLNPIVVTRPHNEGQYCTGITRVSAETPWLEIYDILNQ